MVAFEVRVMDLAQKLDVGVFWDEGVSPEVEGDAA